MEETEADAIHAHHHAHQFVVEDVSLTLAPDPLAAAILEEERDLIPVEDAVTLAEDAVILAVEAILVVAATHVVRAIPEVYLAAEAVVDHHYHEADHLSDVADHLSDVADLLDVAELPSEVNLP